MKKDNKSRSFLKNVAYYSVPIWVSFALNFISVPIKTRLFLPEEIGKINLFSTYLTMFIQIALLGLDQAFVRFYYEPPKNNTKQSLMRICLIFNICTATIISIIIFLIRKKLSNAIIGEYNIYIIIYLAICIYANIFLRISNLYYRMENNVIMYSIQVIILAIIGKILYAVVAFWNPKYNYAILVITLGYLLVSIIYFIIQKEILTDVYTEYNKETIYSIFKFGLPLIPVTLLSWLNNSIGQFFLKKYSNFSTIGIYSNAIAIASIISLIQTGFNTYWSPFVYANYKNENSKIKVIHQVLTYVMVTVGLAIIFNQDIIFLLIGQKFKSSKVYFPLLLVSPICYTVAETTGIGINISKKSYLNAITFGCSVIVNIFLCYILMPKLGVIGAAISAAISGIIMLIIKTFIGERYYKCVSNYYKTFSAILILVLGSFLNIALSEKILIRSMVLFVFQIILTGIYKNEFFEIIKKFVKILQNRKNIERKKEKI